MAHGPIQRSSNMFVFSLKVEASLDLCLHGANREKHMLHTMLYQDCLPQSLAGQIYAPSRPGISIKVLEIHDQ